MASFLLASWGLESHLDVFLAVADALRRRGHQVSFYTAPAHQRAVEAIGCRFVPFVEVDENQAESIIGRVLDNRGKPWRLWRMWRQFLIDTIPAQVNDLRRLGRLSQVDVLVSDIAFWGVLAVLKESEPVPVAMLSHIGFCLEPGEPYGPVAVGAMPPRRTGLQSLAARARILLSGLAARDARKRVNAVRAIYGLPPQNLKMTQMCGQMDLYLIPSSASFDYNRTDVPANVRYVGACLYPPPAPAAKPQGPPRVVVDEGGLYPADPVMIQAAVQGLESLTVDVVLGKGREAIPAPRSSVRIHSWRPVQQILPGAAVLVTNANTDSVNSALHYGIPMVLVPTTIDQRETAFRVAECGAGIIVREKDCSPQALRASVEQALRDPSIAHASQKLGREMAALGGAECAADHLEALAASGVRSLAAGATSAAAGASRLRQVS